MAEPKDETWLYAGVRMVDGKPADAWIPLPIPDGPNNSVKPTDHELLFPPQKGDQPVVGSEYTVSVSRADRRIRKHGLPVYLRRSPDDVLRAAVEVATRSHKTQLRLAQLERSDRRASALDEALKPLMEIAARVSTPDRPALVAYVTRKLHQHW